MRFRLIDAEKARLPIDRMCALLAVSASGYYAWAQRGPSRRQLDDLVLLAHVRAHFAASNGTYGSPRMHAELCAAGVSIGRHRTARLMRDNHLKANQKRRFKKTTDSDHGGPVAANLLDQNFACNGPDQKWGVDISYVWTAEGWLYLAIVLDLFSRRIVSWATSDRLKRQLALEALHRAIMIRQPPPGLLHHSEREVVAGFGSYDMPLASASSGTLRGRILGNGDGEVEIDLPADSVGAATVAAHEAAGVIVRPHIDAAAAESTVEGETRVYQTMPIRAFLVSATDARSGWPAPVLTATPEELASASAPRLRGLPRWL